MANRFEMPMPSDAFKAFIDAGANEAMCRSVLHQFERFWEGQKRLLDEYDSFTKSMLQRRRTAADATLDMVRKMSATTDGAEWARCYSDWLTGSFTRVAEDGRDMIQEGMKILSEVSQNMSAGMAEATQATSEAQQSAMREAAAAQGAAAEQGSTMAQEAARSARVPPRPKRPEERARA